MSDKGTVFLSDEIRTFYEHHTVQTITSAPYHVSTKPQAERYVAELKKAQIEHTTVHTGAGTTPAEAMFRRDLSSPLHAILPAAANAAHWKPSRRMVS